MLLYLYISGLVTLAMVLRLDIKNLGLLKKFGKILFIFLVWPALLSIMLITLYDIYGDIEEDKKD
jgi:hypothetical protein